MRLNYVAKVFSEFLLILLYFSDDGEAYRSPSWLSLSFRVNLGAPMHIVSDTFVSHTIDSSILARPSQWKHLELLSPRLIAMCKALAPAYLRFGGTQSDYLLFNETAMSTHSRQINMVDLQTSASEIDPVDGTYPLILLPDYYEDFDVVAEPRSRRKHKKSRQTVTMSGDDWDKINQFSQACNWKLLHCLNSHTMLPNGTWDPSNTAELINYTAKKGYKVDWSLGNEPLGRYNITGRQLAQGLRKLKQMLRQHRRRRDLIVAPDLSRLSSFGERLLLDVVDRTGEFLKAATFHHYYGDGRTMRWRDLVDPHVLNNLLDKTRNMKDILRISNYPSMDLWITETSSAYGGGASVLSSAFVGAIAFADKLGLAATLDVKNLMRQSLFGGNYRLFTENLDPNPEFWVSVLHKKLMGTRVQGVRIVSGEQHVRVYAHRVPSGTLEYPWNSVTVLALNIGDETVSLWTHQHDLQNVKRYDYILSPENHDILSSRILLNGEVLEILEDNQVPELLPVERNGHDSIDLEPLTFGFFVYVVK